LKTIATSCDKKSTGKLLFNIIITFARSALHDTNSVYGFIGKVSGRLVSGK